MQSLIEPDVSVRVSVVIPTYNRRDLVCQTIRSALQQTFPSSEVIVVDDGSTDGTQEAVAAFDDQVHYVWQENQGESAARNRALALARGEYVALLDSDDLWVADKLRLQVPLLDARPELVAVGCASWIVDCQGRPFRPEPFGRDVEPQQLTYAALRSHNAFPGPSSAVVRKAAIDRVGGFDPDLQFGEDWDLWLRLAQVGRLDVIPQPLAFLRRHPFSQSLALSPETVDRRLRDHLAILAKNPSATRLNSTCHVPDAARAGPYLRATLDDLALGRERLARERLLESARHDGGELLRQQGIPLALDRAVALAEPDFAPSPRVLAYFDRALRYISEVEPRAHGRTRNPHGRLYLSLASMARGVHNGPAVRAGLWRAFRHTPGVCRQRAFWGGLLDSFIG